MSCTYDHGNPRSQSPIGGEDQPYRGSEPVYIDPYGLISDVQSQSPYASSETRYATQYGTRSIGPQQGYGNASPYHPYQNSGYGYASFSSSLSRHATPAYPPQPVYTGNNVGTTRYTNSDATHSLPIHPVTIDATRIPPPNQQRNRKMSHTPEFTGDNYESGLEAVKGRKFVGINQSQHGDWPERQEDPSSPSPSGRGHGSYAPSTSSYSMARPEQSTPSQHLPPSMRSNQILAMAQGQENAKITRYGVRQDTQKAANRRFDRSDPFARLEKSENRYSKQTRLMETQGEDMQGLEIGLSRLRKTAMNLVGDRKNNRVGIWLADVEHIEARTRMPGNSTVERWLDTIKSDDGRSTVRGEDDKYRHADRRDESVDPNFDKPSQALHIGSASRHQAKPHERQKISQNVLPLQNENSGGPRSRAKPRGNSRGSLSRQQLPVSGNSPRSPYSEAAPQSNLPRPYSTSVDAYPTSEGSVQGTVPQETARVGFRIAEGNDAYERYLRSGGQLDSIGSETGNFSRMGMPYGTW
ncbi:hypothetical protein BPAE_0284g00080 [Botrytis paeoniae]|uniref:Uncharacterized protein n=1 Tax=Botrytis paeoniae TaxID=278948 RepID=A0A4Z1FGJ0_9HELO|nr:hypothetical protein BPAE_0284g00080 [Botrytis paeoniae]